MTPALLFRRLLATTICAWSSWMATLLFSGYDACTLMLWLPVMLLVLTLTLVLLMPILRLCIAR